MTRFTEDTWLPAIFVICWFLLVVAILGVVTRLGTKWWIYHKFTKDDYVIILAIVLDIAQGIAIATATGNGYGNHITTLNDAQKNAIMKSQYAASMLSVGSLAASKISFVMFVRGITAVSLDRKIGQGIIFFLTLWGIVSIITVAFQCQFPPTWNYLSGKCYDRQTWENFFSISNVITEIAILIHTVMIIARIQTRLERKLKIAFVFGLRLTVIVAAIVQIVLLNRTFHDPDVTYATWSVSVANQFVLCSSIITACSAQFKPFLDSLRSSGMRLDALTGIYAYKSQRSYGQRSYGQDSHSHRYRSHRSKTTSSKANTIPLRSISGRNEPRDNNTASNEVFVSASTPAADWDAASATSQSQIIRETRTVTVTEEFRRSSDAGVSL